MADTPFSLGLVDQSQFGNMNSAQRDELLSQVKSFLRMRAESHPNLQITLPKVDSPVVDVWQEAAQSLQRQRGMVFIMDKYNDPNTPEKQRNLIAQHLNPSPDAPRNRDWFAKQSLRFGSDPNIGVPLRMVDSTDELLANSSDEVAVFTDDQTVTPEMRDAIQQATGHEPMLGLYSGLLTGANQVSNNGQPQSQPATNQNKADLPEYYFIPGTEDHPYKYADNDVNQTRYWWRSPVIAESSAVTTKELKNALSSVLSDRTKQRTLAGMLPELTDKKGDLPDTLYASAYHDETGALNATLISQTIRGRKYNLSPSQVETMITVLTTLHDAGISYDLISSNQGTIQLKLNDNTGSKVTLMDLQHPYLTGQVETREGISWSPMLSHIPYKTALEQQQNPNADPTHALANELDNDGNDLKIWESREKEIGKTGKYNSRKVFAHNSQLVENIASFSSDDSNAGKSILRSNERYMALDQTTKNMLATSGLINVLGIDPQTFDANARKYMPDANIETIDMKSGKLSYTAQLNLGSHHARLNKVHQIRMDDDGRAIETPVSEQTQGDVVLDLRGAVWGKDIHDTKEIREKANPYVLNPEESTELLNQKYAEARMNYFDMLTGVDQKNMNRGYEKAQLKFKEILFDEREVATLTNGSLQMHKEKLKPLAVNDQKEVLEAFGNALTKANPTQTGVDDQALQDALDHLNDDVKNPVAKQRRKQVFLNLVEQMQNTFGAAPSYNGPQVRSYMDMTPVEYHHQYDVLQTNKPTWSSDMGTNNNYNKSLKALVPDDAPAFTGLEKSDIDNIRDSMTYAELREQVKLVDQINQVNPANGGTANFDRLYQAMITNQPLNHGLNVTQIIDHTSDNSQANLYEFKMAQAAGKSKYASDLVGDNDVASQRIQERAVQFDPDSAQTINDLLAADQDPNSDEAKLRRYIAEVQSGEREFSLDDPANPNPKAFKFDGPTADSDGLIVSESPNHFKVDMLREIKSRIEKKLGTDQNGNQIELPDDALKIDQRGVVHYDVEIPLYNAYEHSQMPQDRIYRTWASMSQKDLDAKLPDGRPKYRELNGYAQSVETGSILEDFKAKSNAAGPMVQHLEGSFGQIFPVEHDGRIYSNYNRFAGQDPKDGQIVYQARYRGWVNGIPRDENGDWDIEAMRQERENGLGIFNRLRVSSYKQGLLREVRQAADLQLATRDMGDVTRYNSNTSLNKTLHGSVLGEQVKNYDEEAPATKISQSILEDELHAVRLNDEAMSATKVTALTSYINKIDKTVTDMKKAGTLTPDMTPQDQQLAVMREMHDPAAIWGNVSIGELANDDALGFFSDNQTGQGGMLGLLRVLLRNTKVNDDGSVEPDIMKNQNGTPYKDANGQYVFRNSGTAIENLEILDGSYKSAFDRQSVSKEQLKKALRVEEHVGSARMSLGALTMEDGMVVSKAFAEKMQISDQFDEKGKPIVRGLAIGDKMSDIAGDKATISAVIDPDMDPVEAEKQGLLDVVQMFKQNPNLDTVWNPSSQISRNNGATAANYLEHESSDPMSYQEVRINDNGDAYETGRQVQTGATINDGVLFVTDQTVNHKVSLYENPGDQGRKASVFMTVADNAKDASAVANWHLNNGESLRTWHEMTLALGIDFDAKQVRNVDYDQIAQRTSQVDYQLPDDVQTNLNGAFVSSGPKTFGQNNANVKTSIEKRLNNQSLVNDDHTINNNVLSHIYDLNSLLGKSSKLNNDPNLRDGSYDAGGKFLEMIPDGGVLKLPDNIKVQDHQGNDTNQIYVLPRDLRTNTMSMDDRPITSDTNLAYARLGKSLARYETIKLATERNGVAKRLYDQDPTLSVNQWQDQINQQIADKVGVNTNFNSVSKEVDKFTYGGSSSNAKNSYVRNEVMGGHPADTVTTQLSSNPNLPIDVIEVSPQIAKRLGFETNQNDPQGLAHMKDHEDWDRLHVHRDPIWRPQGSLGFRVKVSDDPSFKSVRVNPVMASLMDADFDGDNVGLIAMGSDATQSELKEKMPVDRWMLDNNQDRSLLNINAELVDTASRVNNTYTITGVNGDKISGQFNDPEFRKRALENMRDDVVDPKWFKYQDAGNSNSDNWVSYADLNNQDNRANLTRNLVADTTPGYELPSVGRNDKDNTPENHVSDAKFLAALVDHEIKQHYDQGDYRGARQSVDEMIQLSRGFDVSRDKNGEVVAKSGDHQPLADDGVRYTNKDQYYQDLMRFVQTGAKGSQDKVDGLMDYINKPRFSDLQKLAQSQVKNGQVDQKAVNDFRNEIRELHDNMKEVQRATKTKSDATGVPGSTQQRFTYPFIDQGVQALKDAVALGQPGTQKVLSIKRDPVGAAQAAELLQVPLGKLLNGSFPESYPTFSLVGATSNGRLGTDMVDAGIRANELRALTVPGTDNQKLENANPRITDEANFSDDKVKAIMQQINLPLEKDPDKLKDQVSAFRKTADEATQPFVRHDLLAQMKKELHRDKVPYYADPDRMGPTPIAKDEFVLVMNHILNDDKYGLGLGVDKQAISRMADRMVDPNQETEKPNSPKASIGKLDDIVGPDGRASLLAKVTTQGFDAMSDAARKSEYKETPLTSTDFERKAFLNMDDETFDAKLYRPDDVKTVNLQDQALDSNTVVQDMPKVHLTGDDLALNTVRISPADAKALTQGVDSENSDNSNANNYLLRSNTDGDMAVRIEVDDRLKPGEMQASSELVNRVDLKDAQLVAGNNDMVNDHIDNLSATVMTNSDQFTKYQNNAQYKIQKRRLQLQQSELLTLINKSFNDASIKPTKEPDSLANLEAKSKAGLKDLEAKANGQITDSPRSTTQTSAAASNVSQSSHKEQSNSIQPLKPSVPVGDQASQMIRGTYKSPTTYKANGMDQTANNVAGQVALTYLHKAQQQKVQVNPTVVKQVETLANNPDYLNSANQVYRNLNQDYKKQTGKPLFTQQETTLALANSYLNQMNKDQTVRDTLVNSQNQIANYQLSKPQEQALNAAINRFAPTKQTSSNVNSQPQPSSSVNSQSQPSSNTNSQSQTSSIKALDPKPLVGDQMSQMIQGTYHSPTTYKVNGVDQTANNVSGQVAMTYLHKAQQEHVKLDPEVVKQVETLANNRDYANSANQVYQNLSQNYKQQTGKPLFTPRESTVALANAYLNQMSQDKTVRDTLVNAQNKIPDYHLSKPQELALNAAISRFAPSKNADVNQNANNHNNGPKGPDDGPRR